MEQSLVILFLNSEAASSEYKLKFFSSLGIFNPGLQIEKIPFD